MSESDPRNPPLSASARLARLGAAGVGMTGRSAMAGLLKVGAGAERRQEIDIATHERNAAQLFRTLSGLKGAATKIGQVLAQQTHSLPEPYTRRLAALQWQAPAMHGTLARLQFRKQLGSNPEELFTSFERRPFAAASLGQVHRAKLKDATPVAVKIQYPGIDRTLKSDLNLFAGLLKTLGWNRDEHSSIWQAMQEVRERLLLEADYQQEATAMEEFRKLLAPRGDVIVPRLFPELSTERVLTMELITGAHPGDTPAHFSDGPEAIDRLATRLLDLFFHQTFDLRRLHADPNPGNYLLCPDDRLALLDFGCTQHLSKSLMGGVKALFLLPIEESDDHAHCYSQLGLYDPSAPRQTEKKAALARLRRLDLAKYHQAEAFDFGDARYLRRMNKALTALAQLGLAQREFIFYMRTRLGLYHLFHQLGARVRCRDIVEPYLVATAPRRS